MEISRPEEEKRIKYIRNIFILKKRTKLYFN